MDTSKYIFPLEDNYHSKVELFADGFYYAKEVPNGALLKAPFDCVVKTAFKTNEQAYLPGALNTLLSDPYDVYQLVYESKDGSAQFSVSDVLPNDKSRNIGASFKAGENIGRVLSPDRSFAYKFYEAQVVNPEAPRRDQQTEFVPVDPSKVQQQTTESEAAEKEARAFKLSTFTLVKVMGVIIGVAFAYKLVKGK